MNRTEQLKKQHDSINQLIVETNKLVKEKNLETNASVIAKNISTLDEMGNLRGVYIEFKNEFYTKSKIM
ncbi:MAG: hypothetical protein K8R73_10590 [Clostridiales bacterium]|nr:hypothetical protein [Clostridiales bacterium]